MRNRLLSVAAMLALTACQAAPTAAHKAAARTSAAKVAVKPASLLKLAKGQVLAGTIQVDASYVVGARHGQLISQDGGTVLAAGDAKLISQDGGTLISQDGGTLISQDGGTLISQDGGTIVAQGGGNAVAPESLIGQDAASLISQDGGTLISQDGGTLISQDGGTLISQDGGSYRLMAAATPTRQLVPAAGMVVYLRSLATGKPVAVGTDAAGKPAYAVYSDFKGGYRLTLPDGTDNVEVVAQVPGATDPRLTYAGLLTSADGGKRAIDDDTAVITRYVRTIFAVQLAHLIAPDARAYVASVDGSLIQEAVRPLFFQMLANIIDSAEAGHVSARPAARREALALALADRILAKTDLAGARPTGTDGQPMAVPADVSPDATTSLKALEFQLRTRREEIANDLVPRLAGESLDQFFGALSGVKANPLPGFRFERPADFNEYVQQTFMLQAAQHTVQATSALSALVTEAGLKQPPGGYEWMRACAHGLADAIVVTLFTDPDLGKGIREQLARGGDL